MTKLRKQRGVKRFGRPIKRAFTPVKRMQPIFKEMIKMWQDMGMEIPIKEGTYWYDSGIMW